MKTITEGKYSAKIRKDADGWFVVVPTYENRVGSCFPIKSYKTESGANRYAKRFLESSK